MLGDLQKFLFRGNVIDLAVAVVIGAAFEAVVQALVRDLVTPLIAALVGTPNFGHLAFTLHHARFPYGDFLNALISFLLVGAAVFYLVVVPANAIAARVARRRPAPAPTTKLCPECCGEVPVAARRCMHCTSALS